MPKGPEAKIVGATLPVAERLDAGDPCRHRIARPLLKNAFDFFPENFSIVTRSTARIELEAIICPGRSNAGNVVVKDLSCGCRLRHSARASGS
jgi:hypothetical protein